MTNEEKIGRCLHYLKEALTAFVRKHFPEEGTQDVANSLKLIAFRWNDIDVDLPRKARTMAHELIDIRNEWAHQVPFSDGDTDRALDTAERLANALGESDHAVKIGELRNCSSRNELTSGPRSPKVVKIQLPKPTRLDVRTDCRHKLLGDIPFNADRQDDAYRCLMDRLGSITAQVYGRVSEKAGPIARQFVPLEFEWVNESRIEPVVVDGDKCLQILLHIGDTKEQGGHFYDLNPTGVIWPREIRGRDLLVHPYIKIGDPYSRTILWIRPSASEVTRTHSRRFFEEFAGSVSRQDWASFGDKLSRYVPDWREKCFVRDSDEKANWEDKILAKKYQTIRISVGTNLRILIPYAECVLLDDSVNASRLAGQYKETIEEIKRLVEKSVTDRIR